MAYNGKFSDLLADLVLHHQINLQRLQKTHLNLLEQLFKVGQGEMAGSLIDLGSGPLADFSSSKLKAKILEIRAIFEDAVKAALPMIVTAQEQSAIAEAAFWHVKLLDGIPASVQETIGVFAQVNPEMVQAIGDSKILGLKPSTSLTKAGQAFAFEANLALSQATGLGEDVTSMARRLMKLSNKLGREKALQLARDAVISSSSTVADSWADRNQDVVGGQIHTATLDTNTCRVCGGLDGTFYGPKDPRPELPIHGRCRCVRRPVAKSFREMGVPIDDIPPDYRASDEGPVPAELVYDDWIRKQPAAKQIQAMGPGVHAVWMEKGQPPLSHWVEDGSELSLEQILSGT